MQPRRHIPAAMHHLSLLTRRSTARTLAVHDAVAAALSVALQPVPARPLLFDAVIANLSAGAPVQNADMALRGYKHLRTALVGGAPGNALLQSHWREALACGYFAAQLAWHLGFDLRTAAAAGLLHRCGEAAALAALALVEEQHALRLDAPSRAGLCAEQGEELATRLLHAWSIPPSVTAAALGWRHSVSEPGPMNLSKLVYLAHLLALACLEPEFAPPGLEDAAANELGVDAQVLGKVMQSDAALRALLSRAG
ncbi:MAG: HDOD domain-containing protein [Steroidobacteraceae bacterium]